MGRRLNKNKSLNIDISELEKFSDQLSKLGDYVEDQIVDSALAASQEVVKKAVLKEMKKHNKSGETAKTVIGGSNSDWHERQWYGSVALVPVGFDIGEKDRHQKDDRLSSVFLMYGTKVYGQPHEAPDRALYNAVYGEKTKKEIRRIHEEVFDKVLRRLGLK